MQIRHRTVHLCGAFYPRNERPSTGRTYGAAFQPAVGEAVNKIGFG